MAMRLDKFLSHMGYGTRNEVKTSLKMGGSRLKEKQSRKLIIK